MARNDYGPLRDAQHKALDAANNRAAQAEEPAKLQGQYQQARSWTAEGGMVQQQASAIAWAKANKDAHENTLARQEARETFEERKDQAKTGHIQENAVDAARGEDGQTQQRSLKFFEDQDRSTAAERSGDKAEREDAVQDQSKGQGGERTLTFFDDRTKGQDQDLSR